MKILFDCKNELDFDYQSLSFRSFDANTGMALLSFLSIKRIGGESSLTYDFAFNKKTHGDTTLIQAINRYLDKAYYILLKNDKLVAGFEDTTYLIGNDNILVEKKDNIEHYKMTESNNISLVNSFPNKFEKAIIKPYGENIIINGKLYNISNSSFYSPEFCEIITLEDCDDEKSIIYNEDLCPKELRKAIQDLVKKSNVDIGVKDIKADEQLLNLDKEEYLKTIAFLPIIDGIDNYVDFLYYDPIIKKIICEKIENEEDFIEKPKKKLNSLTEIINQQRKSELEKSLYVNAITSISDMLPIAEQNKAKEIVAPVFSKKYNSKKEQ